MKSKNLNINLDLLNNKGTTINNQEQFNDFKKKLESYNTEYFGNIERFNLMFNITVEKVQSVYVVFIHTVIPLIQNKGNYYDIEFTPKKIGTGTSNLTIESINETVEELLLEFKDRYLKD